MLKLVENYIRQFNMIEAGDEVIAGVSGGADSVCMLLNLLEYRNTVDFNIKVVHINHLIREEAGEDAAFVEELCREHGIECHIFNEEVEKQAKEQGISTEEAGRKIRYQRFAQLMTSDKAKIAVAHNRNDVAETVLFNIFRGTGIEGLASLLPVNGNIIRPLIGVDRMQIEQYLQEKNQNYCTDASNLANDYARNKIRNVILPYAENEIVCGAANHVAALSEKMALVRDYIAEEVIKKSNSLLDILENSVEIDVNALLREPLLIRQELILKAFDVLTQGRKDIGQVHVEAVLTLLAKAGEKRVDLPYSLEAVKQYDRLIIRKKEEQATVGLDYNLTMDTQLQIEGDSCISVRVFDREEDMDIPQNTYTKWFDYDKILGCLKLRNRRPGDYLTVNSQLQKKSLKDYMIDVKIPREMRDRQLLIADDSHILWLIGYRISEYYKVTEATTRIIEITVH